MKVYTKKGDSGNTSLIAGVRKKKSDPIFDVLGTIDELNAYLGTITTSKKALKAIISQTQCDLMQISAYVAGVPITSVGLSTFQAKVQALEAEIDKLEKENKPLKNFILPGGSVESAQLHYCRAVCRRLERKMDTFLRKSHFPKLTIVRAYLNRLSDYLFVLARWHNAKGKRDIIWVSS